MTQQYIAGEFSALVGALQPAPGELLSDALDNLRREVELAPPFMLPRLAEEALSVIDMICWVALEQGDVNGFRRYADSAAALRDFTVGANLLR